MKKNATGSDSEALSVAIAALMTGMGRGGLTYLAERLGMTPSAMRKRLLSTAPFDEPTMRATLLIGSTRAEDFQDYPLESTQEVGSYIIETRNVNGESIPTWRVK